MFLTIKFGGDTVSTGERIRNNVRFLNKRKGRGDELVVVTSAMRGVTDELLRLAGKATSKEGHWHERLEELLERHVSAAGIAIEDGEILSETVEALKNELRGLEGALSKIENRDELTDRLTDLVLSYGERMTVPLLAGALADMGVSTESLTGYEAGIVTDENYLDADPILNVSRDRVSERLNELLDEGKVPIVTGFVAATEKGEVTTMGRGSSDFSASLIGSALDVDEIWIMTDVQGIMTADPAMEPNARVIDQLSYLEATELSHFGAEVLNPKTIRPAMDRDIPVRVKSAFDPSGEGTLIVHRSEKVERIVKAITTTKEVSIVTVGGPSMIGTIGVAAEVLATLEREGINVLMISQSSSQTDISFAVERKELKNTLSALQEEFESRHVDWRMSFDQEASLVSAVGAGMKGTPGVAGRIFSTMGRNDINVLMISQGSSELNISFAVEEKAVVDAVRTLHEEFHLERPCR